MINIVADFVVRPVCGQTGGHSGGWIRGALSREVSRSPLESSGLLAKGGG